MTRLVVLGDPQAPADTFFAWLDHHRLRGPDGRLADGVRLISIGDHFDFRCDDVHVAGDDGIRILRWLASHPPERVVVLLGNHDVSRVMELASMTDARFADAREKARVLSSEAFHAEFPDIPTPGLAARDYTTFSEAQRALVIELLLSERAQLATTGRTMSGREVLLTHAGVTTRELSLLGKPDERDPTRIAQALNAYLARAVEVVRDRWARGEAAALDLAPLHVAGASPEEGGGLLYHRPANPERPGATPWETQSDRRFDPRTLPLGLMQVCGHTNHEKAFKELRGWVADGVPEHATGHRTLSFDGTHVTYALGVHDTSPAALVMIDPMLHRNPPSACDVLDLAPAP